jgi:hypothetical protein
MRRLDMLSAGFEAMRHSAAEARLVAAKTPIDAALHLC